MAERKDVIERAYQLINEPIDPNLRCPVELVDIVNYRESEPGETIEYFASSAQDRAADDIYAADANGAITYHKVALKAVTALTFVGLQSKLETVLIDEILNSKDQTALAQKKDSIIRAMDCEEVRRILNLVLAVASQEVEKASGEDLLDVIINMKQKVSNYATDYILLVASDVMDEIEEYDKANVTTFNYKMSIMEEIAKLGIKKVVKVLGNSGYAAGDTPVIANGKAILVGRNSGIAKGRPITFLRRKFSKEIAELCGAQEGAVRLIDVAKTPTPINAGGTNTLGYGVFGYESIIQVLTNFRAVSWSDQIIS
jgi:hypothetical protein